LANTGQVSSAQKKGIKNTRKEVQILKSSFRLFSSAGLAPMRIHALVKCLGIAKDYIDIPEMGSKYISQAIYMIKPDIFDWESLETQSADPTAFHRIYNQSHRFLNRCIGGYTFPVRDFHDGRKTLRHLLNAYFIGNALHPDIPEIESTYCCLDKINLRLGTFHDDIVREYVSDEVCYQQLQGYNASLISIPAQAVTPEMISFVEAELVI
jgi:hypothetical protein